MVGGWIKAEGGWEGRGDCLKYLKGGGMEKRGRETKILKRGGQAGPRGGCLKRGGGGGAGTPLRTITWEISNITWEISFFKNHAENEAGRLVPNLFLFFKECYVR